MSAADVAARLDEVRARIVSAGGDLDHTRIVAVTKGFGPDAVSAAAEAGLVDVAENYGQELLTKAGGGTEGLRWHFLGAVQRNKVAKLAPVVALWQSVDRIEEVAAIGQSHPGAAVLLQVNLSGDPAKEGCSWDDLGRLIDGARRAGVDVQGLMGVGPAGPAEDARPGFAALASAARTHQLATVSMGMSGDIEVAVQEGSTMVRVGTALFGPRPRASQVRR